MKLTLFTEELRECLNAARLSDCGENDSWNYWYQRVLKAHNDAVERQIATEQVENAKLRELCTALYKCLDKMSECGTCEDVSCPFMDDCRLHDRMRELGVEV